MRRINYLGKAFKEAKGGEGGRERVCVFGVVSGSARALPWWWLCRSGGSAPSWRDPDLGRVSRLGAAAVTAGSSVPGHCGAAV